MGATLCGANVVASAQASYTAGRLRRHSPGGAHLPPVAPSLGGQVNHRGCCYWWEPRFAGRMLKPRHRPVTPPGACGAIRRAKPISHQLPQATEVIPLPPRLLLLVVIKFPPRLFLLVVIQLPQRLLLLVGATLCGAKAEATATSGNTTGRLRRHSPGGAHLPPVAPSLGGQVNHRGCSDCWLSSSHRSCCFW